MNKLFATVFVLGMGLALQAQAQTDGLDDARGKREAMMMGLYPPDIIMRHQQQLGITDAQRRDISSSVQKFQSDVSELQWSLQNEQQLMRQSMQEYPIDSKKALAQVEKVLALESQFKQAHFKLLVAIKNELTQEQVDNIQRTMRQRMSQRRQ